MSGSPFQRGGRGITFGTASCSARSEWCLHALTFDCTPSVLVDGRTPSSTACACTYHHSSLCWYIWAYGAGQLQLLGQSWLLRNHSRGEKTPKVALTSRWNLAHLKKRLVSLEAVMPCLVCWLDDSSCAAKAASTCVPQHTAEPSCDAAPLQLGVRRNCNNEYTTSAKNSRGLGLSL